MIDPNNPTGAVYPEPVRRALIDIAESAGVPILADEVYGDVAFVGTVTASGIARARRADHFVFVALESVPGAGLADGLGRRGRIGTARRTSSRR